MPQPSRPVPSVQPRDWVATYFIGVAALALVLTLLYCLILQVTSRESWSDLGGWVPVAVVVLLVSVVVIGVVAALPCALCFWLAQRFTWRHLSIYLLSGAVIALPTIPVVMSLSPGFPYPAYNVPGIARYQPVLFLFSASGAFLGAIFWWRSGRHLG